METKELKRMERSTGERIRKGRALRGMTLRELADKVGVSHTHISNLERGGKEITGATLIALSEALDPVSYTHLTLPTT